MKVPEGRPTIARRFDGGFRLLQSTESHWDERKHAIVRAISAAPAGLSRCEFTPTVKTVGLFSFVPLGLDLRRAHSAGGACARPAPLHYLDWAGEFAKSSMLAR